MQKIFIMAGIELKDGLTNAVLVMGYIATFAFTLGPITGYFISPS